MHKRIVFRDMDHSEAIENYANQQLEKIVTFLENERTPIYIDLVLEPSKTKAHNQVELRVKTPNYDKISSYEGPKFYDILDRVIDIMYKQLREQKKKDCDRLKTVGRHEELKKQR